ncbi:MAG: epoxyqueuosine reductase [Lachnospiraceae bacterium]|nr:epoxyqueuosine reductase [Lachnospiraceae bacterium]
MNNKEVKDMMYSLGADLCGVASVDRFEGAPKGFHPLDVLPICKSVISFGVRFPVGALLCDTPVPYTRIRNSLTPKMDAIALNMCIELEKRGIVSVPIPTNESLWDEKTGRWRSIISQKHAAQAAGVGTIGRHSLLITPRFGSMVWLGCILCDAEIEPDEMLADICVGCNKCVQACPVNALAKEELNQQACWDNAFGEDEKLQTWVISCHKCRDACPYNLGTDNSLI